MRDITASMPWGRPTGIDVLIVGAGIGGLFCAVEMYRHGHNVRVLESKEDTDTIGDFIGIGVSATRQFKKWPGMMRTYKNIRYKPVMSFLKFDGEVLGGPFPAQDSTAMPVPVHRAKLQRALYEYVISLGITVTFGHQVVEYLEANDKGKAAVMTQAGQRYEADLIVAADGVGSKSWKLVQGLQSQVRSSGFAVYRTAYPTHIAQEDPLVAQNFPVLSDGNDDLRMYLAQEAHAISLVSKDMTTWTLTHKDEGNSTESWSRRMSADVVLDNIASSGVSWDPAFLALIRRTPGESIVDWRLLWRDPVAKWVSDCGRVVQIGDAAHSFLPTSANGGTQACEDAMSLAACLSLGGSNGIPLATRVHNTLRFERVSCCQRNGFRNREMWHHTDYEEVKKHPEKLGEMTGRWITEHDAEQYVYENWEKCVNALVTGTKFQNTNIPSGYEYTPWTIDEIMDPTGKGTAEDKGDWS